MAGILFAYKNRASGYYIGHCLGIRAAICQSKFIFLSGDVLICRSQSLQERLFLTHKHRREDIAVFYRAAGSLGKLAESIQYFIAGGVVGGTAVDVHKTLAAFCFKDGYAENISVNIFSAVIFRAAV